jgi:glycosyltransferase involved in cell wall biosynthesis
MNKNRALYRLSIITINYNNLSGLKKTVESVINQTCRDFQYIIIDGGSTDGSAEYIKEMQHHFQYSVSEPDKGIYHAMNKGVKVAAGEYLLFLNSGDYLVSEKVLSECIGNLTRESFITCDLMMDNGRSQWVKYAPDEITFGLIYHHTIMHPATFITKDIFVRYGLYNEKNRIVSDWEQFFIAFCLHAESYKKLNVILTHFDTTGISNTNINLSIKERQVVIERHFYHLIKTPYGKYLMDNTRGENKRIRYLMNIEKSKLLRRVLNVVMYIMSKMSKQIHG